MPPVSSISKLFLLPKQNPAGSEVHLFPFIGAAVTEMSTFYHQIFEAMVAVHNEQASPESVQAFVKLAKERYFLGYHYSLISSLYTVSICKI